ncbi:MAG: zinc protease [Myxococcota bacterium]|jgi:zinc protease
MILVEDHDYPFATVELYFGRGSAADPPGKEGLAWLTGQMLMRGAGKRSHAEHVEAVEVLGGSLDVNVGRDWTLVDGDVLSRNLTEYMTLLGTAVSHPTLAPEELDKLKRRTLADIEERRDNDEDLGEYVFRQVLLAPSPGARPVMGTATSIGNITLEDVRAAYRATFCTSHLTVGWAGDVTESQAQGLLARSLEIPVGGPPQSPTAAGGKREGIRVILVDKPDRQQSQIAIGTPGPHAASADFLALDLGNTVFGGTFKSRLTHEIREKRGWSYSASSHLEGSEVDGSFAFRYSPTLENTVAALEVGLSLYGDWVAGGSEEEEVAFAREYLANNFPFRIQTPRRQLSEALRMKLFHLPDDYLDRWVERLLDLDTAAVNGAVNRHLGSAGLDVVVVCSADGLVDGIQGLPGVREVIVHPWDQEWSF